jgi:hypothetical protein
MIISRKHRYLFVELPRTGSTAISRELREYYDGTPILQKHATYNDFLNIASPEEKKYFVFAGIRNPLGDAVSLYFKLESGHHRIWTDPAKVKRSRRLADYVRSRMFRYVNETKADFPTYFKKFYKVPYNTWSDLSHRQFDFIIRFENLQEDFADALRLIGIEPKRPLPIANKTNKPEKDYLSYYTPDIIPVAKRVFGPYMKQWGYTFPPEWGDDSNSWWNEMEFMFINFFRRFYWRYLRARI